MAWSKHYQRTTRPEPYDSVLFCGICGLEVHVTRFHGEYGQPFMDQGLRVRTAEQEIDQAAAHHLQTYHRLRYWLWQKLGWRWLVGGLR